VSATYDCNPVQKEIALSASSLKVNSAVAVASKTRIRVSYVARTHVWKMI
jgi:hypothetical protein